ncbi:MAG: WYL domain-containing protein [Chitinophagales bacterium]
MIGSYRRSGYQKPLEKQMHYSPNLLNCINNAIDYHLVAVIEYDSREKGITVRDIEPMAVVYKEGKRNLVGWCRMRNDYRSFRLDRLNLFKISKDAFQPRADFNIDNFQDGSTASEELEDN